MQRSTGTGHVLAQCPQKPFMRHSDGGSLMRNGILGTRPVFAGLLRRSVTKVLVAGSAMIFALMGAGAAHAEGAGGEANLKLPDLSQVQFLGVDGHKLLL